MRKLAEFYLTYWTALTFIYFVGFVAGKQMPNKKQLILDVAGIMNLRPGIHCDFAWYVFLCRGIANLYWTVTCYKAIARIGHKNGKNDCY